MGREKEEEWGEAQKIGVSIDLVEAAHNQLQFLALIDRNRHLYQSPSLDWAIYRYNAFWLPLLAKHLNSPLSLVVPLDCEWIWHCHRLNPVRYKSDCLQLFGTLLHNPNVISSLHATSHAPTRQIWKSMYPNEPYELQSNRPPMGLLDVSPNHKFTTYDLVSAVNRQIPFTFQVSRPHMSNRVFLQEAVARYKGFLHLIATNKKNNIRRFCVPTYDIDLIWHSHQLHPHAYCKDLTTIMGKILEHDDTDSDRTKGQKLDTGFSETTKQWEETFGFSYWKAGAMYRGPAPTPVTHTPFPFSLDANKFDATNNKETSIQFPALEVVEVLLQFIEIKNLKEGHKEKVFVSLSKKQPDKLFNTKRTLSIFSESGEKQAALFQCEPTGELVFELISNVRSYIPMTSSSKPFGSCSLSLKNILASATKLSVNEWLSIVPVSSTENLEPILLHVSISFTIPEPAPQTYHLVRPRSLFKNSCLFPLRGSNKSQHTKSWTRVIDDDGNDVISLQMRNLSKEMKKINPDLLEEVYYITDSGETNAVANCVGNEWRLKGTYGTFELCGPFGKNGHLFELIGHKMVKLFSGRRLDYEPKHCERQRAEEDFITAVEFSSDYPYGRAVALIDLTRGIFTAKDEWMLLPGITLTFILSIILKRKGYVASTATDNAEYSTDQLNTLSGNIGNKIKGNEEIIENVENPGHSISQSGGCGSGCGSGCGNAVNSGGCGSGCGGGCGSGCGNAVNSGGCGSGCGGGCGSGCGNAVTSGGCGGGGCGSGCGGSRVNSGGCGGGCGGGGGCGNTMKSGGCGGCGSGGCGNKLGEGDDDGLNEV